MSGPVRDAAPAGLITLSDARKRAAISIAEAGQLLGISRSSAYECASRGDIPTLRMGGRRVVPVPRLLELVGYPLHEEAPGTVIPSADVFATGRQAGGST